MKKDSRILKLYEKHVAEWVGVFGLKEWRWRCEWTKDDNEGDVTYNIDTRWAYFGINRSCKKENVRTLALHEVLHLVMADYSKTSEMFFTQDYLRGKEHAVIHRIMNAMEAK